MSTTELDFQTLRRIFGSAHLGVKVHRAEVLGTGMEEGSEQALENISAKDLIDHRPWHHTDRN